MRTLYVRIIVTTMAIMITSSIIAFIASNVYYQHVLKPENDKKITHMADNIVDLYNGSDQAIDHFLRDMADLGYSFYLIDNDGQSKTFGKPFDTTELQSSVVQDVLSGNIYHGIANYPWQPFVTGFFDHALSNTIGLPINANDDSFALFVRPNSVQQFGEMRIFFAVIIGLALFFSFLFVLFSTRWIVNPIQSLTVATKKIAAGNYHIKLAVNRKDEIGRLARNFSTMSESLQKTEEKRQEFVASVSHEIQSPLTSIQGFSQALQEENLSNEERIHYLSIIEKESKRLSVLSRQLLTLSQLDQGNNELERIPFDLSEQMKEILFTLEWQWRQKNLSIEWDAKPTVINGDPKLLHQVWMNVITNAIRYTLKEGKISITVKKGKANVEVIITDTGIGISQEDIPQIFDRFYKADKARTRKAGGTGLGLAITKKIVELHAGTIMVKSEEGQGTAIIITLPQ